MVKMEVIGFFLSLNFLWILIVLLLLPTIIWIVTLIMQLKSSEYAWFVFTLLIPPVLFIYYLVYIFKKLLK